VKECVDRIGMGAVLVSVVAVGMKVVEDVRRFGGVIVGEGVVERVVEVEAMKDVDCVEMEDAEVGY